MATFADRTQALTCVVGRDASSAVCIDVPSVSSRHALLAVEDGALVVTDLGSANGTFVRGERVKKERIWPGDRVLLGSAPLPWEHPEVVALVSAISVAPAARKPSTRRASPAASPDEDTSEIAYVVPTTWTPRRRIAGLVVGALGLCGVGVLAGLAIFDAPPSVEAVTEPTTPSVPSPVSLPAAASVPASPYFTASDPPRASETLFARRLADQIDMDGQNERVRELRFRLTSEAVAQNNLGVDRVVRPRPAWAVPLGVVQREGRQILAVATTRCVVDYRYPMLTDHADFINLAIFSGEGRSREVFRLGRPTALLGLRTDDQQRTGYVDVSRHHLDGPTGERYFGALAQHPEWYAEATLPVGDWRTSAGVDMVVLYFPLADPGTGVLQPRRNLKLVDPEGTLRQMLAGRTSAWGDTFQFDLVSSACMQYEQHGAAESAQGGGDQMLTVLAFAAGFALLGPILAGPLLESLGPAILQTLVGGSGALLSNAGGALTGQLLSLVWRTIVRANAGESLVDAAWGEAGTFVLEFARSGGADRMVLAGLSEAGLDPASAARVAATVRSLVSAPGSALTVMAQGSDVSAACRAGQCMASVENPGSRMDVTAEILSRGLARLDTSNEGLLAQQPGLIAAAREAFMDPTSRNSAAIADADYRRQVNALATRLVR